MKVIEGVEPPTLRGTYYRKCLRRTRSLMPPSSNYTTLKQHIAFTVITFATGLLSLDYVICFAITKMYTSYKSMLLFILWIDWLKTLTVDLESGFVSEDFKPGAVMYFNVNMDKVIMLWAMKRNWVGKLGYIDNNSMGEQGRMWEIYVPALMMKIF